MHASLSLWQDLKILSTEEREEVEAMRNGEMTSGKKPAEAVLRKKKFLKMFEILLMVLVVQFLLVVQNSKSRPHNA